MVGPHVLVAVSDSPVVLRARDVADDGIRSGRRSCCVGGVRLTHAINRLHLADVAAASEQSASSAPSIGHTLPTELLRRSSPPRPRLQLPAPGRRSRCVHAVLGSSPASPPHLVEKDEILDERGRWERPMVTRVIISPMWGPCICMNIPMSYSTLMEEIPCHHVGPTPNVDQ
jgi:hypothetical protein